MVAISGARSIHVISGAVISVTGLSVASQYFQDSNLPVGSGATLIQMLQILEHFDLGKRDHSSARHLDLVSRAMEAEADRFALEMTVPGEVTPEAAIRICAKQLEESTLAEAAP